MNTKTRTLKIMLLRAKYRKYLAFMAYFCVGHLKSELEDEPCADKNDALIHNLYEVAQVVNHWHDAQIVCQKKKRRKAV